MHFTLSLLCASLGVAHGQSVSTVNENETDAPYRNVYGRPLAKCSGPGMALTGFTRDGGCTDRFDDRGSHHVCIKMDSLSGDNFCVTTGQSNWCDTSMACDGAPGEACPIKNWCVCEWAFAGYIAKAGGCEAIKEINCEATNLWAVKHYRESGNAQALACLESRCG
eukprot:CAMPEP_0119292892 /NCGR_PEP_ID=MMETSP1329-20130426/45041_1 /TAXON_ID=114041 /ORGANISM="Genus nov. species nov., Strain RCC1024" /LENGTH=165 /DNA_ID=CAMNT_0007293743 /DNA_START=143 /DNA_END=637 /DNA_ORIENTATION=+